MITLGDVGCIQSRKSPMFSSVEGIQSVGGSEIQKKDQVLENR